MNDYQKLVNLSKRANESANALQGLALSLQECKSKLETILDPWERALIENQINRLSARLENVSKENQEISKDIDDISQSVL